MDGGSYSSYGDKIALPVLFARWSTCQYTDNLGKLHVLYGLLGSATDKHSQI